MMNWRFEIRRTTKSSWRWLLLFFTLGHREIEKGVGEQMELGDCAVGFNSAR
jgi:hypothetical protein